MCGRFVSATPPDEIAKYFGADAVTEDADDAAGGLHAIMLGKRAEHLGALLALLPAGEDLHQDQHAEEREDDQEDPVTERAARRRRTGGADGLRAFGGLQVGRVARERRRVSGLGECR